MPCGTVATSSHLECIDAGTIRTAHVGAVDTHAEFDVAHGIDPEVFRRRWWTLSVLCLSLLIIMIGNTSLNVALPSLSEQLNATTAELQWMVDAYSLVFAGLLFAAGNFGDRYGRKGILQLGLVLFGLATGYAAVVCGDVPAGHHRPHRHGRRRRHGHAGHPVDHHQHLPGPRARQGRRVVGRHQRRRRGHRAACSAASCSSTGSWNAVFAVNLPFIVAALVLGAFLVPRSRGEHGTPLDLPGAILSAVGLSVVVYAIIEGPIHGWLSATTLGVGAAGLATLAAFVLWELRIEHPMLDVRLFRVGAFGVSSLVLTLVFFALMGTFFSMSQMLQLVWGYSPLEAAIRLAPISVAMMIAAPQSARFAARFGKRRVVASGMWMVAAGVLVVSAHGRRPDLPRSCSPACSSWRSAWAPRCRPPPTCSCRPCPASRRAWAPP